MTIITISEEKFNKVLADVEVLIEDVASLFDQDEVAKKRREDVQRNPSIGKTENDLDKYLKKRGVLVD